MWQVGSEWNGPFEGESFDLDGLDISPETLEWLRAADARELSAVPVEVSASGVVLAMSGWDQLTIDKLTFMLNRPPSVVSAKPDAIQRALDRYYPVNEH
jgi:hypothetical protein